MIGLLEKLLIQRDEIHRKYETFLRYTPEYQKRLSIIRKVLVQEKEIFEGRKVSDRIVSIDRHSCNRFGATCYKGSASSILQSSEHTSWRKEGMMKG